VGAKFFFFTDPALLAPQTAAQAFGPAGTSGGKDQFRVTDLHTSASTDIPAFAVCDGILCAQEDAQGTLTVILKPSQTPPFESPVVSYFIYKGVAKSSLLNLNDGNILDEGAADATDFSKKIAKEWKTQNAASLAGSRAALGLDRDATFLHEDGTTQTAIFTDNDPIDRLFTYPHKTVQLPTVAAGDHIGSFQSTFGFEIVLLRLGYKPKLAFARSADNNISVTSLSADNHGVPWVADDYAFFAHWHEKEQVLAFMDPCAYFGSFVQARLYKKSGSSSSKVNGSDVYQEILQTFANKNIAWLDIRNNYSYSYNLFGLYGDTIRFVSYSDASATNDKNFRSGSWPILQLRIADVQGSRRGSLHRTRVRLPVGLSMAPAVFVSKGLVTRIGPERAKYKAPTIALASPGDTHYAPIRLSFPVTSDNGQDVFVCSYSRVNLYEKPRSTVQSLAPLNIEAKLYLDGVFRLRDLRLDIDFAGAALRLEIYPEEVLVDLEGRFGPTYAATIGISEDTARIILFAFPSFFLPNMFGPDRRQPLTAWASFAKNSPQGALLSLAATFRDTEMARKTITPAGASGDVDLLIVRHNPSSDFNSVTDGNALADFCVLAFTKADHAAQLAQIAADTGSESGLPAVLTASASQTKVDASHGGVAYAEVSLQSIGFSANGAKAAQHATPLTKKVYEYANS
jgi:hypothetical protein